MSTITGQTTLTVLVVQPDADARGALCRALGDLGHEVQPSADEKEALRFVVRRPYDLAVTEVSGVAASGSGFLATARRLRPGIAVLLINDQPGPAARETARSVGAALHTAPLEPDLLLAAIDRALDLARPAPEGPLPRA